MKKRNKHWEYEREYHKLLNALEINQIAQRNLGYIELEHPIPHGFNAYFVLREDVANRDDAWVFQGIIDHCGRTAWRRRNTFETVKDRRKTFARPFKKGENEPYPDFRTVDEREYNSFVAEARKWFTKSEDKWGRIYYYVNVPIFYYEIKVEQHYRTKAKVFCNVLLQEEVEIEKQLYFLDTKGYRYRYRGNPPADYVRFYNVSHRREEKRLLHATIFKGKEDLSFPGNQRHSARWDWW